MALTDEAIVKIKAMIMSGDLGPGDRLPPEKELSESLGLSRSTLREAVKALAVIHVLDVRRGDGTYVTSLEPKLLLEAMTFVVDIHQDSSILELFTVRRILEPSATAMATVRATPGDIKHLRELLGEVDELASIEELVAHDKSFHRFINTLSGNAYLAGLLEGISSNTMRARVWRGFTEERTVERTLAEHRAIVHALGLGDAELARSAAIVHISGVEQWLRQAAV